MVLGLEISWLSNPESALAAADYSVVLGLEATNAAEEVHGAGWRPGWGAVAALGRQLAQALAHMHAHGVVHRCAAWGLCRMGWLL